MDSSQGKPRFTLLGLFCCLTFGCLFLAAVQKHGEGGAASAVIAGFFLVIGYFCLNVAKHEVGASSLFFRVLGLIALATGGGAFVFCFWWPFAV